MPYSWVGAGACTVSDLVEYAAGELMVATSVGDKALHLNVLGI